MSTPPGSATAAGGNEAGTSQEAAPSADPEPAPFEAPPEVLARVEALRQKMADKPGATALYLQLSQVYSDAGRQDLAIAVMQRLLDRDPRNAYIRHRLELLRRPARPAARSAGPGTTGAAGISRPARRRPPPSGRLESARDLIERRPRLAAGAGALLILAVAAAWQLWPSTRRVVAGEFSAFAPVWSPGGEHFAFLIEGGAGLKLAVYDMREGSHRILTDISGWGRDSFAWSPGGLEIAYVAPPEEDDWGQHIAVVDVVSAETRLVAPGAAPLWYADATTLLARCAIDMADLAESWSVEWSPVSPGLCRIDTVTGTSEDVADLSSWRISFSPVLGMIAYESIAEAPGAATSDAADEELQEFVDAVVGDQPRNVAEGSRNLSRELEARGYMEDRRAAGDEAFLAYASDVFVTRIGYGRATRLTDDGRSSLVSWTPDGLRVLYATAGASGPRVWTASPDGSERRPLLDSSLEVADPHSVTLSADGEYAFFVAPVEGDAAVAEIMTGESPADLHSSRVGSSTAERLANEHPFKQRYAVSPDGVHVVYEVLGDVRFLRGSGRSELWLMSR